MWTEIELEETTMDDSAAYRLIGQRAEELTKRADVQKKMMQIAETEGTEKAKEYVYRLAIATLVGVE